MEDPDPDACWRVLPGGILSLGTAEGPLQMMNPFLTLKEAAEVLRLHPRTVREYVRRGELAGRLIGGRWRFRRQDLDAFFEKAPTGWQWDQGSGDRK
jgi:excisionase family DNA binding protein